MKLKAVYFSLLTFMSVSSFAQEVSLDKVVAVVDQGVVLESQIQEMLSSVKRNAQSAGQSLPSDKVLRTQTLDRLILVNLQMQQAERMGIQISDPQLEQTIANIAQQDNMTLEQLRFGLAEDGIDYESYREQIRVELITGEVRRARVRRRVYITPGEVDNLVKQMDEQGAQQVEYNLGHILIAFPPEPTEEDIDAAKTRADKVLEVLNNGTDFAKVAIASSSGSKALEGGDMGWMNINSMPTLFAGAIEGKKKSDLIGPIRSGAGFHILNIADIRGLEIVEVEEVKARHILIKPSIILSEDKAKQMLADFREQLISGEADFTALAKEHSEDPGNALKGGVLDWADPNIYDPAFRNALANLEKDEFSQPFRSSFGWHLTQLLDRRVQDAADKRKQDRAYQLLFNRKFAEETEIWLREMKDSAFIDIMDPQDS